MDSQNNRHKLHPLSESVGQPLIAVSLFQLSLYWRQLILSRWQRHGSDTKKLRKGCLQGYYLSRTLHCYSILPFFSLAYLLYRLEFFKDVQCYVGHKDGQTTMNIYARSNEKQQTKVTKSMTELIFACG